MVMSGAHAAAFTPRLSKVAAVPSPPHRLASHDEGYVQQVVSGERSFAMKLHDWLATHFNRPIYVGSGGAGQLVSAGEELLDVVGETPANAPTAGAGRPAYKQRLQGDGWRVSKADLAKLVYLLGRSRGAGEHAPTYASDTALDLSVHNGGAR